MWQPEAREEMLGGRCFWLPTKQLMFQESQAPFVGIITLI